MAMPRARDRFNRQRASYRLCAACDAAPAASRLMSLPHPKHQCAKTCRALRTNLLNARKCVTSAKLCAALVKFLNPIGHGRRSARLRASPGKVLRTYPGIPLTHAPFLIN